VESYPLSLPERTGQGRVRRLERPEVCQGTFRPYGDRYRADHSAGRAAVRLTAGLGQQNISAITSLPADKIAFQAPSGGHDPSYSNSTVTQQQWKKWSKAPDVESAEPLGITTTKATAGDKSTGVSAFGVEPGSRLAPASTKITGSTVVLSTAASDDLGVKVGDSSPWPAGS
jgi:hypothetical protein